MRTQFSFVCCGLLLAASAARGESSSSISSDGHSSQTNPDFPTESRNPDAKERQRLVVRWEKAGIAYYDFVKREWTWQIPNYERLPKRRVLGIRATLSIKSEDGKSEKPIDWMQGVRVIVSREANAKPDWTKPTNETDTAWSDCVIQKDGSIFAQFSIGEIRRCVGRTERFQIGLSLGIKSKQTIDWRITDPVLPQSIETMPIEGPSPLSPTMQAINGAPSIEMGSFDPVMLIRAVNHLHSLGKEKAISELRSFLSADEDHHWFHGRRDPANIDTSDIQCVFLIVRLLFEPKNAEPGIPWMHIGQFYPNVPENDRSFGPLFPLVVQDDIPFLVGYVEWLAGMAENPLMHVEWAEKYGKLRPRPLRPADDPLQAVENLVGSWQFDRVYRPCERNMIRLQAARMLQQVTGRTASYDDFWRSQPNQAAAADWQSFKRSTAKLTIRWDEKSQSYVAH